MNFLKRKQSTVHAVEASVDAIKTSIDAIEAVVDAIKTSIDAIEAGIHLPKTLRHEASEELGISLFFPLFHTAYHNLSLRTRQRRYPRLK